MSEIKEHLEKAQNPLFYYDNDADGLCSFLLLRRFLNRGKGVAIRSYPDLNKEYVRKARELNADYVFILDKPVVSGEFISEITNMGIPMVWIDHHDMENGIKRRDNIYIYNTAEDNGYEPVSYISYKLTRKKEDLWIALMGCISDHYLPDFADDFAKEYPELWNRNVKKPFDAYFKTEIGKIALALNFGLMDSTTNIVKLQNYLINCKGPGEVLEERRENKAFREKCDEIKKKYDSLVEKAKENIEKRMIFFEYGGDLSISSEIANELYYDYSEKYIIVAFKKGVVCNLSLRGKNVKTILEKVLKSLENATGGGHSDAVGARIRLADLGKFKELISGEIEK